LRSGSLHGLSLRLDSLHGRRIAGTGRRGKLLLLHLEPLKGSGACDAPHCLVIHLRITGRLMTWPEGSLPGPHTRCIWDLRAPNGLSRSLFFDDTRAFGLIIVASPAILQAWDFWRELGPEPLELPLQDFAVILAVRKAAIKAVLLDQKAVAGIGNIYADESLFRAGIDPRRSASGLKGDEVAALWRALQAVLHLSIEQCGSSIRDYRDANGDVGAFQNSFAVYGRGGQACKHCGRKLVRIRVAGRSTVVCTRCQR
ncbi:MAG: bifunctional DNA-formamidopyrimidine glycosylase/DNA-(apurinic or apyrimidinic site) lyase, partial [Desulfovibrionaceae bacterium]|nr:bifunctional DNA-formamidopyrimidine glycosylase/DNA-(apurinic or apyrimidinic site) lyase [Desulfovibrionaceae bacterium]